MSSFASPLPKTRKWILFWNSQTLTSQHCTTHNFQHFRKYACALCSAKSVCTGRCELIRSWPFSGRTYLCKHHDFQPVSIHNAPRAKGDDELLLQLGPSAVGRQGGSRGAARPGRTRIRFLLAQLMNEIQQGTSEAKLYAALGARAFLVGAVALP